MTTKISASEREFVREELVYIADRLVKNCKLTIAESRRVILEILTCSI